MRCIFLFSVQLKRRRQQINTIQTVALENTYYSAKGLRETDVDAAAKEFESVIEQEQREMSNNNDSGKSYGPWSFKAMKQQVKLYLRAGRADLMMKHYRRLLECIADGDVSPNAIEKGINGMLERVASLYQHQQHSLPAAAAIAAAGSSNSTSAITSDPQGLALAVYDATLKVFHPRTGNCKNERLWFKTNLKYGQLLYEMNETNKLQSVLRDLMSVHKLPSSDDGGGGGGDGAMGSGGGGFSSSTSGQSTQSLEIYALQIQLYSRQKDHKKLRETFRKAMAVRGGIPHPRTLALIQELGGKMHMLAREYEQAEKTFFQAFKSYDEAGDPSRLRCLKYLVLASMLHSSTINPFDSQEARPYRDDPEIVAMTNLVQAFHNNEIQAFETILRKHERTILKDEFVREHIEDLLRTIRRQVLRRVIVPYERITLQAIARELNDIPVREVEQLLVGLVLDGQLDGTIDRVEGILYKKAERSGADGSGGKAGAAGAAGRSAGVSGSGSAGGGGSGGATSSSSSGSPSSDGTSPIVKQCEAMDSMTEMLGNLSSYVTSLRVKDPSSASSTRGMMIH